MRSSRYGVFAAGLVFLMSCGGSNASSPTGTTTNGGNNPGNTGGSTSNAVAVADNNFNPSSTTVAVGTTVTWTWTGASRHNVTFDDGPKSADQSSGTFTRAFTAAGTYNYHCTIHGTAMSGTVTVP